jgi:hypothetical protein
MGWRSKVWLRARHFVLAMQRPQSKNAATWQALWLGPQCERFGPVVQTNPIHTAV